MQIQFETLKAEALKLTTIVLVAALLTCWNQPVLAVEQIKSNKQKTKQNKPKTAWQYFNKKDDMSGEIGHLAWTSSTNRIQLEFPYQGGTRGWFKLQNHPRFGEKIIFQIDKGQLICNNYDGCTVVLKFDDNPPVGYHATQPSDYSSTELSISGYDEILENLKTSKYLIIEAEFYQAGMQHFKFNINGLEWQEEAKINGTQ
jgi:hypothetical protein